MRESVSSNGARVRLPRAADVVADRIRERIFSGQLAPGARLPRLQGLLDEFGVSGPSMREALRILETEGLITVARGSVGGAIVRQPTARTAAYSLALVLESRGVPVGDLGRARELLEPVCTLLCARRPDRADAVVPQLERDVEAAEELLDGDEVAFTEAMNAFHASIIRSCGNDTLRLLAGAVESMWFINVRAWAADTAAHGGYPSLEEKRAGVVTHRRLCGLIASGADLEAAHLMTEHIEMHRELQGGIDRSRLVQAHDLRGLEA